MSKIAVNFDDAQEPKPVAGGRYDLQILECKSTVTGAQSKNPGSPQFRISIGILGEAGENAPAITHFISLPNEGDEKKSFDFKLLLLKRFLVAFKVPFNKNEIDTEELPLQMVGSEANLEVVLTEPNDKGDVYNGIKVPPIKDEPQRGRR